MSGKSDQDGPSRRNKVSSNDVARLSGISRATVSRTFSNPDAVKPSTRRKVIDVARELGYEPNSLARMLNKGQSDMVAVLTADFFNPFQPAMIEALTDSVAEVGMRTLLLKCSKSEKNGDSLIQAALSYRVAAIVVTVAPVSDAAIRRCFEGGVPLVLLNRIAEDSRAISVCGDLKAGAARAAEVLFAAGHKRIAMITGRPGRWTTSMRRGGFQHRLDEFGLDVVAQECGNYTYRGGAAAARTILDKDPRVDAIYACNDAMAFGTMDILRHEYGKNVPEDVAVLGFDDVPMSSWSSYHLSTIHQPMNRLFSKTVDILSRPDRGLGLTGNVFLETCRFIQRNSTYPVQLEMNDLDQRV